VNTGKDGNATVKCFNIVALEKVNERKTDYLKLNVKQKRVVHISVMINIKI